MPPMTVPAALVRGVDRVPLPFGLFSVVTARENTSDRWENGVEWETLTCEPAEGLGAPDCDSAETPGMPKSLGAVETPMGAASPFTVYGHHTCSPIGNSLEWAQERARQHLLIREEARVEQALWTGDLGNVPNFAGANGYDPLDTTQSFDIANMWHAVSVLEQIIARDYGGLGVMHMNRANASRLMEEGKLRAQGLRLFTALGTPVVAGTGYGTEKIVATPALFRYESEIFDSSNRPYDLLDRRKNDLYAIAERTHLVGFDPCGATEAPLTLPEGN